MTLIRKILIASATAASLGAGAALAAMPHGAGIMADQGHPLQVKADKKAKKMDHLFDMLDANKDGSITLEEATAFATGQLAKMDQGKDGGVDAGDIQAARPKLKEKRAEKLMNKLDTSKDGKVTKEEIEQEIKITFADLDKDHDGKLTRDEFAAAKPGDFTLGGKMGKKGKGI